MDIEQLRYALIGFLIVISSLALHEWGHAFTADKLGDDTPRRMGRVTLNPLVHLDPIGTLLIPLIGMFTHFSIIGWAKPVYTNPSALRTARNKALVTIAGPGMNFLLALIAAFAAGLMRHSQLELFRVLETARDINVGLMVFNLLPIPPLDGSKFLMYWFGMSEETYVNFSRFSWMLLLAVVYLPTGQKFLSSAIVYAGAPFSGLTSWVAH